MKSIPDSVAILDRNARALILDGQLDVAIPFHSLDPHSLSLRPVFDRVVQQVQQNLTERIAIDPRKYIRQLNLREGNNYLSLVVPERAFGWGFLARLERPSGVEIQVR